MGDALTDRHGRARRLPVCERSVLVRRSGVPLGVDGRLPAYRRGSRKHPLMPRVVLVPMSGPFVSDLGGQAAGVLHAGLVEMLKRTRPRAASGTMRLCRSAGSRPSAPAAQVKR